MTGLWCLLDESAHGQLHKILIGEADDEEPVEEKSEQNEQLPVPEEDSSAASTRKDSDHK